MAKKTNLEWHEEKRKVSDLVPNIKNPRTMSPKQVDDLKKSLVKFGIVEAPVIDTDNKVLCGHQRLAVLKLLGRGSEVISVRVPSRKLSKSEYDQYLLISNRVHGDFDWDKLAESFDIETILASGFDDTDLSHLFEDLVIEDDGFVVEKEIKKIKKTNIKTGDHFILGSHSLVCGDSTDESVVRNLVGNARIDLLACDSPYNIGLSYDKGVGGKSHYQGDVDDNKSDTDFRAFTIKTLSNGLSVAKKDVHVFWWCSQSYVGMIQSVFQELGINYKSTCLWIKNGFSPLPQTSFNRCYEPCVYGTINKPQLSSKHTKFNEIFNTEIGNGNATIDDISDMIDIWLVKRLPSGEYEHPTQKPITLSERPLLRCTKVGDNVLDLFGGSGSTLLACEQLKRNAFLVEKNPIFCQLIINRYEHFTNKKARKIN